MTAPRSDREVPESGLYVVLPGWAAEPDAEALAERVRAHVTGARVVDAVGPETWRIAWDRATLALLEQPVPDDALRHVAQDLSDEDRAALQGAHLAVRLGQHLAPDDPLGSYHRALGLLHAVAPDGVAFFDDGAGTWRPHAWLARAAESVAPPAPTALFTIHAVVEGRGEADAHVWLHTHGLRRCGAVELEILDVPRDRSGLFGQLLNAVAAHVMEQGAPPPGAPFAVGHDLEVAWLPWREALRHLPRGELGRGDDRDADHDRDHGVLLVPGLRRRFRRSRTWHSPLALLPVLEDEPIFWVSASETRRMALLANERYPAFRDLATRCAGRDGWRFLVKLGYTVDPEPGGEDGEPGTEHLWFEVHAVDGAQVDATLLNEPVGISRMRAGDREWHAIDQLSDWVVHAPIGAFDPGRIDLLLARLARD